MAALPGVPVVGCETTRNSGGSIVRMVRISEPLTELLVLASRGGVHEFAPVASCPSMGVVISHK